MWLWMMPRSPWLTISNLGETSPGIGKRVEKDRTKVLGAVGPRGSPHGVFDTLVATHYYAWGPVIFPLGASSCPDGSHLFKRIQPCLTVPVFSRMLHASDIDPLGVVDPVQDRVVVDAGPRAPVRLKARHRSTVRPQRRDMCPSKVRRHFPVVGSGSRGPAPAGLNRLCSSMVLQRPSDCLGRSAHLWPGRLTARQRSPVDGKVAPRNATGGFHREYSLF